MKSENLVTRIIADETLIVPVANHVAQLDAIYTLNEIGSTIWKLLDDHPPMAQIVETLVSQYEVSPETAEQDTREFLAALESGGLIHPLT